IPRPFPGADTSLRLRCPACCVILQEGDEGRFRMVFAERGVRVHYADSVTWTNPRQRFASRLARTALIAPEIEFPRLRCCCARSAHLACAPMEISDRFQVDAAPCRLAATESQATYEITRHAFRLIYRTAPGRC